MDITAILPVTHNSRGLGDLLTEQGEALAPVLFRSDALASLTPQGQRGLADLGIGYVVDLRTDGERQRAANAITDDAAITSVSLPIQGGAMDEMVKRLLPSAGQVTAVNPEQVADMLDQVPTLEDLYISMLESSPTQFATLARTVVDAAKTDTPGVLFHCTAGKDRTGLAAALLLSVAGVSRSDIVADYSLTETNIAGSFAEQLTGLITSIGIPLTPQLQTLTTRSPQAAMATALDWVSRSYGSVESYLHGGGLSPDDALQLRRALVIAR